jgi:hypothetical protein
MGESDGRDGAERENIVNAAPFSELPFLVSQGQQLWFCCNATVCRGRNANLSNGVPDSEER